MGCDGGTIPRRDELVRVKQKPEQKDKDAEREFRWRHCALTQERLREPIVICGLGRLYTKQNVIEQLLEKDKMPESAKHIKSMKDIKTLQLTPNPAFTEQDKSEGLLDTRHSPYICKLIGLEMTGKFRFVALWSCGCVVSERALKQIKGTSSVCPLCQTAFGVEDVVLLNASSDEDLELMHTKIEMRAAKRKAGKKDKKDKKKEQAVAAAITASECSAEVPEGCAVATAPFAEEPSTSKAATASVSSSKVTAAAIAPSKLKLVAHSKRVAAAHDDKMADPEMKRLKSGDYSVARDPKATDVYKSLFTTHHSEQEQSRAHWVTYNPFYN